MKKKVDGTRFEIIIPCSGDLNLLRVKPSSYTYSPPKGNIQPGQLQFIYEVKIGASKEEIKGMYTANLHILKTWLSNLESEVNLFNKKIPNIINAEISNRKRKLDEDSNTASFLGLPIK